MMKYPNLNLPQANLKLKGDDIWDILRLKFVKNTPEEWVRQHFIHYLNTLGYSKNLMKSEHLVKYNNLNKRCDIVVFDTKLNPIIIVECKAPHIKLTKDTFYQVAKYHSVLQANLLILSNGNQHINALIDNKNNKIDFIKETPNFDEFMGNAN